MWCISTSAVTYPLYRFEGVFDSSDNGGWLATGVFSFGIATCNWFKKNKKETRFSFPRITSCWTMKLKLEGENGNTTQGRFIKCVIGLVAKVQRMNDIFPWNAIWLQIWYNAPRLFWICMRETIEFKIKMDDRRLLNIWSIF